MTPQQRTERARRAANMRWARPTAQQEQREAVSRAKWTRLENQVDPEGVLPEVRRRELAQRALNAEMAAVRMARARKRAIRPAA
jgi:hypothetical protein